MSKKKATHNSINTLFDFIYIDKVRLYSLVSQLNNSGITTQQIIQLGSKDVIKDTKKITDAKSATGSIPTVATGTLSNTRESNEENANETHQNDQHTINTEYLIPLKLVEGLVKSNLALKKIDTKHGQLIYFKGNMNIRDTSLLKVLYEPLLKIGELSVEPVGNNMSLGSIFEIVKLLPHTINMTMDTQQGTAWATLKPDYLLIDTADWLLKHGANIAGEWHCLAILDRKPADDTNNPKFQSATDSMNAVFDSFFPEMSNLIGLPKNCFAVTPIAIFRELTTENLENIQ